MATITVSSPKPARPVITDIKAGDIYTCGPLVNENALRKVIQETGSYFLIINFNGRVVVEADSKEYIIKSMNSSGYYLFKGTITIEQ